MRRLLLAALLPAMALVLYNCAGVERPAQVPVLRGEPVTVRAVRVLVGIAKRGDSLKLSASKPVGVWKRDGAEVIATMTLKETPVTFNNGAVVIGDQNSNLPTLILAPTGDDTIRVGDNEYPGYIFLFVRGESVLAVNCVGMEDYIAGVVSCELPSRFDSAALEAQAVAARTYALFTMVSTRMQFYDLKDDQSSQVYRGLTGTNGAGRRAAQRTAGVVMVYDWKFAPAFYFSTCGGHTAPYTQMRGAPAIGCLTAVPCDYCKSSRLYRWEGLRIPAADMEKLLAPAGYVKGSLVDIVVQETAIGGWVETVRIVGTDGRDFRDGAGAAATGGPVADSKHQLHGPARGGRFRHRRPRLRARGGDVPVRRRRHGARGIQLRRDPSALLHGSQDHKDLLTLLPDETVSLSG